MANWLTQLRKDPINESIESFRPKREKQTKHLEGEGVEDLNQITGYGALGLNSFNTFYSNYINKQFNSEIERIKQYRQMAQMPEISSVIEDATLESTQEDQDGDMMFLDIVDDELKKNDNIVNNLQKEFRELFYQRLKIKEELWDLFYNYYIDGRVYYERIINTKKPTDGILGIKRLPTETMDYSYDPNTGEIKAFFQYLTGHPKQPVSIDAARKDENIIVFYPEQVGYINYGIHGKTKREVLGYLESAKQPYNQLKLLETSVVIYRLIRSPERFVFSIDTGNMPKDKAMRYVEKIKQKMMKKQTYDSVSGQLTHEPEIFSMLENFFLPQSADGRGSQVDSIGGNPAGFAELDDIYYFARKLYRALKYPQSRVTSQQERQESDILFGGQSLGEISRDEIKWARFLERQQNRFMDDFTDLFILHLEFKKIAKQYGLTKEKINIRLTSPNNYKDQMKQTLLEARMSNYQSLSSNPEFSKSYLMRRYLDFDEQDLTANKKGFEDDKKYIPKDEQDNFGF